MYKLILSLVIYISILSSNKLWAQTLIKKSFPYSVLTFQYAGSIGKYNIGYGLINKRQNLEFTSLIGYDYDKVRGDFYNINFKTIISPFLIYRKQNALRIKPIQIGLSINQIFNKELKVFWDEKYPDRYYWWPNNTRFHIHLGSELNYKIKKGKQLSIYYEINTNDLYLFSYLPNQRSMELNDILYAGAGIKYIFK